jgi:N-acyl homoserine lactone hydrolase
VLVSKREWVEPYFSIQGLMPTWFNPKLIIFGESEPAGDTLLEGAYLLTEAADLMLIQTPGHTFGHCSVVLKTDSAYYLFGGDISITQDDLVRGIFPPGEADVFASKMTRWKVLDFASRHPLVYLATHDPLSAERLLNGKWLGA